MKFRKKPIIVKAIQFDGTNANSLIAGFDYPSKLHAIGPEPDALLVRTLEGDIKVTKGDWIIKGIKGEYYPCNPTIFEMTYDSIEENK